MHLLSTAQKKILEDQQNLCMYFCKWHSGLSLDIAEVSPGH